MITRRDFLRGTLVAPALTTGAACSRSPRWDASAFRRGADSLVAVLPAASYAAPLVQTVIDGLKLCGPPVRGRRVVLKPNLVEFDATTCRAVVESGDWDDPNTPRDTVRASPLSAGDAQGTRLNTG